MPREEIERVKEAGALFCGKNRSRFIIFFSLQVSLSNRVVKIGFTEKKPRLEKKWIWYSRLLRASVSDIRNWKCKSPTKKA